jgi:hypothetical protein
MLMPSLAHVLELTLWEQSSGLVCLLHCSVQGLGILRAPSSVAYWVRALGRLLGTVTAPLSEMELELLSAAVLLDALLVLVRGLLWVATSVREWELLSEVELECESVPQLVQALEPVLAGVL